MYIHRNIPQPYTGFLSGRSGRANHDFGIKRINLINDKKRDRLTLMVYSNHPLSDEVNALLQGNQLILEAPYLLSTYKPFRSHLLSHGFPGEVEFEDFEIGFSEIRLNHGYEYTVVSCQLMDPDSIKIILKYKASTDNKEFNTN